jgi:uncharacterized protein
MEAITYSLKDQTNDSAEYYSAIRTFTDTVLHNSDPLLPMIIDFKDYLRSNLIEEIRETEEYILELLSFGILWQTYAHIALKVRLAPFGTLAKLAEWRKKHQKLKPYIDNARGVMTTLFLLPEKTYKVVPAPPPTLDQLEHVYKWFMATGEFREQALRFINWRSFWMTRTPDQVAEMFKAIESFTFWFKEEAQKELGRYTENVDSFLKNAGEHYKWREDRISCTRSEEEYHLNMVGAELMNRALRKEFERTESKAVLLPGCMRKLPAWECKATKVPGGLKCMGCTPGCRVNHLRQTGKKNDFQVYVIPHASDLSQWSPAKRKDSLGVVASACLTTLVEGGWELKRYGVPAQCVVLEYSGCKKHWHPEGIETEISTDELLRILQHKSVMTA